MKLEKIAKLLRLGSDQPDTPEGEVAMSRARRELDKLGLTEGDVLGVEATLLHPGYLAWQLALLHAVCLRIPCDLIERTETHDGEEETEAVVRGPSQTVDAVGYLFSTIERAVKKEGFEYGEPLRCIFDVQEVMALQRTFEAYVVIGLSERLMVDEEETGPDQDTEEVRMEEGERSDAPDEETDPLDALIGQLDSSGGDELSLNLDPAIQGYYAGLRIPISRAIGTGVDDSSLALAMSDEADSFDLSL